MDLVPNSYIFEIGDVEPDLEPASYPLLARARYPLIRIQMPKYLKLGITEWIDVWKKNGWKTSSKKKVKNIELWKELDNLVKNHKIKWFWVKAHAGNPINEEVDLLAREAAILN